MYICETEFATADPSDTDYSMTEVDSYAFIPDGKQNKVKNHRLSLRKNLKTGQFEVYRAYTRSIGYFDLKANVLAMTSEETNRTEVVFTGSLQGAITFTNNEWRRFFGEDSAPTDRVCEHVSPHVSMGCDRRHSNRPANDGQDV